MDSGTTTERPGTTHRGVVLMVMCVGMFLVLLDVTVVNVALPSIGKDLGAELSGLQWIVNAYMVVLAALLLTAGTTGDLFGHKRMVLVGLVAFGLASLGCGAAPSVHTLVAARTVQGLSAALLLPGTLAVITHTFPERAEQARVLGIWAAVSSLALPAGPLLGGLLVSTFGWRAVFLVNLPVVVIAFAVAARAVVETAAERTRRLDLGGAGCAAVGLASTVFAVISAGRDGLGPAVWIAPAIAVLAGVAFVIVERRTPDPMLPLDLFRVPAFVGANGVAGAMNFVGNGTIFVTTLYLQEVQGRSAMTAGLELLPLFLPLAVLAPLAGRLTARFGPRTSMAIGLAIGIAGAVALNLTTVSGHYLRLVVAMLAIGIGMGFLTAAVVAAAMRSVPADRAGLAGGVNNTVRQAAGALGIATFGAVAGSPSRQHAFVSGLHHLGVIAAGVWLVAIAVTLTVVPGRPAT